MHILKLIFQISFHIDPENDNSNGSFKIHENGNISLQREIDREEMERDLKGIFTFTVSMIFQRFSFV